MRSPAPSAFIVGTFLVLAAAPLRAQGVARMQPAPTTLPFERYAGSLAFDTPSGQLRAVDADSLQAARVRAFKEMLTRRASAAAPATVVLVNGQPIAPSLACPMPVFMRDSASVPPMSVMKAEQGGVVAGRIIGCQNTLSPVK